MITIRDGIIHLETNRTSYVLSYRRDGLLENLHYGGRIGIEDAAPLLTKAAAGYGMDTIYKAGLPALSSLCLELSPVDRGDYRRGALLARMPHGAHTAHFHVETARLLDAPAPSGGMPQGRGGDEVLTVAFSEPSGLEVELFYTVFADADVITKKMRITNRNSGPVRLERALSQQLDLPRCDFEMYTLDGAWTRERFLHKRNLRPGLVKIGSNNGTSGMRCNPFFFLGETGATETSGDVYGFNLVYSGSHEASVELDTSGRMRVLQGIWSEGFGWTLAPGESFITPEAVLTFSDAGFTGMSHNLHRFTREHILPPLWRNAPRPVQVNNWEGTYFSFNEAKLMRMAREAASLGVELFVLDDGWFGRRNSDRVGLGDYDVNRKKLPSGLSGLARKLNRLGLDFGLWFEPEMISSDSALFEKHPDWIVQTPGYVPATGRYQYVLDLCRPEVREYIIQSMGEVLDSANIKFVKWDMNRQLSDNYSPALEDQGEFMHRYTLGLYEICEGICATRPHILFEGCSSGGNRFDLGMLYYMPQMWTSDDTDAHERQKIQTGTSYGYPPCTMGCHVSAVPNHQTLRRTPLETRFNTAVFGLLGYQLDLNSLNAAERADVRAQVAFYKKFRNTLQYGDFYRLKSPFETEDGTTRWMAVNASQTEAVVGDYLNQLTPNIPQPPMRLRGLDGEKVYRIRVRRQKMNLRIFGGLVNFVSPVHLNPEGLIVKAVDKLYRLDTEEEAYTARGDLLCKAGLKRIQAFSGAGYSEEMRLVEDYASRLYTLRQLPPARISAEEKDAAKE